jgi:hypothetical protein
MPLLDQRLFLILRQYYFTCVCLNYPIMELCFENEFCRIYLTTPMYIEYIF